MSNFQDSISTEELKALYQKALEKKEMKNDAPWQGTGESKGNPELGIVQQAIDAVDDNCDFPIIEFLKGAHYSVYLYSRNIEEQLLEATEKSDQTSMMALALRLGQIQGILDAIEGIPGVVPEDPEET